MRDRESCRSLGSCRAPSRQWLRVAPGADALQRAPTKGLALIGLAIAFGWPLILLIPGVSGLSLTNVLDDGVNIGLKWLVAAGLCVIVFWAQRRPLSEVGIRGVRWRDVLVAIGGAIVGIVLSEIAILLVAIQPSVNDLQEIAAVPLTVRAAMVLTAGICEEFIYRGFAIEQLTFLKSKRWLSGVVTWAFFTGSHALPGKLSAALLVPGILGAILTVLYVWRRNLTSCALMHAIVDAVFIVILPAIVE